jgi:GntR family transcriptional regulator
VEQRDVPVYTLLLQIERTTRDTIGRIVEATRSVDRGDRYRITASLPFDEFSG